MKGSQDYPCRGKNALKPAGCGHVGPGTCPNPHGVGPCPMTGVPKLYPDGCWCPLQHIQAGDVSPWEEPPQPLKTKGSILEPLAFPCGRRTHRFRRREASSRLNLSDRASFNFITRTALYIYTIR